MVAAQPSSMGPTTSMKNPAIVTNRGVKGLIL